MKQLRKILEESGYIQFYLFFGDANARCRDWALASVGLRGPLRVLVSLFLLGESMPFSVAAKTFGAADANELVGAKILHCENGSVSCGTFRLLVWRGAFYFCQLSGNPYAYFGEDSLAMAQYQTPVQNQDVLDLCSGPGIQALCAAQRGNRVTAVEQNAEACQVLRINLAVNQLEARVKVVNERLEDFAANHQETWDQILCNPPLVPMPGVLQELTVWHGGHDGLAIVKRILGLYSKRLRTGGTIEFIGMSLLPEGRVSSSNPLHKLAAACELGGRIHVLSRHAIHEPSVIFEMHAATLAQRRKTGLPAARAELVSAYSEYQDFFLYYCRLQPPLRGRRPRIETIDMSSSHYGGWFS